jgi:hypothetical protein
MSTHLRLHRDPPNDIDTDAPVTYRFPEAMAAARKRLVAGVVALAPTPGEPVRPRHPANSGVLARVENGAEQTTPTDRLLRDVEKTLDDMQDKLDVLKDDAESFKFPTPTDTGGPRAA